MKKIFAIILCLTLVLGAAGCGNGGNVGSSDKTEIVFWHTWNDEALLTDIENYNKTNKDGIEVKVEVISGDYRQAVELAIMSDNAPDVITAVGPTQVISLAQKNNALSLEKYLTDEFKEGFLTGFETKVDGVTYGVSGNSYVRRMVYNKDIFKECGIVDENGNAKAPKTVDEMIEYAKIINEKGNGKYYGMALPLSDASLMMSLVSHMYEPTYGYNGGFDRQELKYTYEQYAPIVDKLKAAYNEGVFAPGSATMNIDQSGVKFACAQYGMAFVNSGFATRFGVDPDLAYDFDMGSCDIPAIGEIEYRHTIEAPGSQLILSSCKEPDKAWKFIEWLLAGRSMSETEQVLNADILFNKEAKKNAKKYFKEAPTSELFELDLENDYIAASTIQSVQGLSIEGDSAAKVILNIILSNLDTQSQLEDASKRYNAALDKKVAEGLDLNDFAIDEANNPFKLK